MGFDDLIVGGQLRVGAGYVPPIKEGDEKINGSAHMEGPVVVGLGSKIKLGAKRPGESYGTAPANLMVTRCYNKDRDCFTPAIKRTLQTEGNVRINGDDGTPWAVNLNGNQEIIGNEQTDHALYVEGGGTVDSVYIDGDLYVTGAVDCGNKGRLAARFAAADASPKPFDLEHPTKGKGHRLRYACIEGPEVAVYHRGRLKDSNTIELPYYWKDLVHEDSITVQLQPIGDRHFHLNVVEFDNEKIIVAEADDKPIDCFYHVYGERKDINPLITEYEGDSWKDYPDPHHYSDDFENRTYSHPDFAGPPNTNTR